MAQALEKEERDEKPFPDFFGSEIWPSGIPGMGKVFVSESFDGAKRDLLLLRSPAADSQANRERAIANLIDLHGHLVCETTDENPFAASPSATAKVRDYIGAALAAVGIQATSRNSSASIYAEIPGHPLVP